jgi:hypothetical protein
MDNTVCTSVFETQVIVIHTAIVLDTDRLAGWLPDKVLLVLASTVILRAESHGTHEHVLLSDGSGSLQSALNTVRRVRYILSRVKCDRRRGIGLPTGFITSVQ